VDQDRRVDELPAIAMAMALTSRRAARDPAETARFHFILRFSVATTMSFVVCEWMGWQPSALAPVLTAVLLASLPVSPPPKVGIALVVIMAMSAWLAFFLTAWLSQTPQLLFGTIGFIMFLAFAGLAQAKGQLPLTLLLMCIAVVPVVTLTVSNMPECFRPCWCAAWRSASFSTGSASPFGQPHRRKSPILLPRLPNPRLRRR
jgi:uncharacterized membrane protein YccC